MSYRSRIHAKFKKIRYGCQAKTAAAAAVLTCFPLLSALAIDTDQLSGSVDTWEWPWTTFLKSLATQLTGPLPMTLGILGIAGAAIALFAGNHGGGTTKFIVLIFAISICLFAPTFVSYVNQSASTAGLTIIP